MVKIAEDSPISPQQNLYLFYTANVDRKRKVGSRIPNTLLRNKYHLVQATRAQAATVGD